MTALRSMVNSHNFIIVNVDYSVNVTFIIKVALNSGETGTDRRDY